MRLRRGLARHGVAPLLASLCLALAVGREAPAQFPQEYAADQIMQTREGTQTGRVFVSPAKYRMEISHEGQRQVIVTRLDRRIVWVLMPEERIYLEMPVPERPEDALSGRDPVEKVERQLLGSETVSGHPTKKYKITVAGKGGTYVGYQWLAQDLRELPIRWEDEQGTVRVELRNIRLGRQPADLFEIPAGFQRLTMPGGLPGMLGGQGLPGLPKE